MNVTDIDGGCEVKSIEALSESRVPRLHITTHTIMGEGGGERGSTIYIHRWIYTHCMYIPARHYASFLVILLHVYIHNPSLMLPQSIHQTNR